MERTEPPPLSTDTALKHWRPLAEQGHAPVAYPQLVSEVEAQTAKPNWFSGALVLMATTFFLYKFII